MAGGKAMSIGTRDASESEESWWGGEGLTQEILVLRGIELRS